MAWEEELDKMIQECGKKEKKAKELAEEVKELKARIIGLMQDHHLKKRRAGAWEARFWISYEAPEDLEVFRSVFGQHWPLAVQEVVRWRLRRNQIKELIGKGLIDEEAYQKRLVARPKVRISRLK